MLLSGNTKENINEDVIYEMHVYYVNVSQEPSPFRPAISYTEIMILLKY